MLNRLPNSRWNYQTAAHLYNRAGFGASPQDIEQLQRMGLDAAVSWFVDYERITDNTPAPDWARPDPDLVEHLKAARQAPEMERREMQKALQQEQIKRMFDLRQWWLNRMATGPRPFQEKMTLFWHGHFATSVEKVKQAYLMWLQNDTFREHAMGSWDQMLVATAQDPAMLIWLDNATSKKEHPNENFAREVMELFALGEGHYTEKDIQESARALTGWSLGNDRQSFMCRPFLHDQGSKTFLGVTGNLDGTAVLNTIARDPQSSRFITARLWKFFAQDNPLANFVETMSGRFQALNRQFKPFMRILLSSEEFYSPEVMHSQVKSPTQWLVSSCRMLERNLPPPLISFNMMRQLSQSLFQPPNVKGWDGGIAWITTSNLLNRYNFAASLVEGQKPRPANPNTGQQMESAKANGLGFLAQIAASPDNQILPADLQKLFAPADLVDPDKAVAALEKRLLLVPLKEQRHVAIRDYLRKAPQMDETTLRHTARLMMSTPEFQLC